MSETAITKKCTMCGEEKDVELFSNCKGEKDGKSYKCKECHKELRKPPKTHVGGGLNGRKTPLENVPIQPFGKCQCGCGADTNVIKESRNKYYPRGKVTEFLRGHHQVKRTPLAHSEDCGYKDDCWIWDGGTNKETGYGIITKNGKTKLAHRIVYQEMVEIIPDDMTVDHLCLQKLCVNPSHMEIVTLGENVSRAHHNGLCTYKTAPRTHCYRGHPLIGDNVAIDSHGNRACRQCRRDAAKRRYYKRKEMAAV